MSNSSITSSVADPRSKLAWMPIRLPWGGKDIPHITIEVNNGCNISCHGCYKSKTGAQKPLAQVMREIDLGLMERNASAVTLMGGEPTLYPQLADAIRYVASKGKFVIMLTNGSLLTPEKLAAWREAGLERIYLHIDAHQVGRPDIEPQKTEAALMDLRRKYVSMITAAGIEAGLAVTLYRDTLQEFDALVEFCHATPGLTAMLVTDYSHAINQNENRVDDGLSVDNFDVYRYLEKAFGWYPGFAIPRTGGSHHWGWLIYNAFVTRSRSGRVSRIFLHPRNKRALTIMSLLPKKLTGFYQVDARFTRAQIYPMLFILSMNTIHLPTIARAMGFLLKSIWNGNASFFGAAFQEPAQRQADGTYETCDPCPDATVRNGKVMPICIADAMEEMQIDAR